MMTSSLDASCGCRPAGLLAQMPEMEAVMNVNVLHDLSCRHRSVEETDKDVAKNRDSS
jgi:hypothetical protein